MAVLVSSRLEEARVQTVALVADVSDGDLECVHSPLMSPLVWDLGHIATFEDLWLAHRRGGLPLLRPDLLEVYDAFETPRARRGELPYLRRAAAEQYMVAVRERVLALALRDGDPLVELVARHERQHAETMLQTLALAALPGWRPAAPRAKAEAEVEVDTAGGAVASGLELIDLPATSFPLGAMGERFAYDNELPAHVVEVAPFAIGRVAVTNRDWLAFIEDGGYRRAEWWSQEGWRWRVEQDAQRPAGWLDDAHERRLDGAAEIAMEHPVVHVSCHEADAFARSRGVRLPSEDEWEVAATFDHASGVKRAWPWGEHAPGP
ncbi:MAG: SUMF1/EgtB/PvdO family nonheme iron enzyme, partial [Solirubrobacteraceae bacterium]